VDLVTMKPRLWAEWAKGGQEGGGGRVGSDQPRALKEYTGPWTWLAIHIFGTLRDR